MESYETRQDVNATADIVWGVLLDGAQYPSWVPGVVDVEGDVADGQNLTLVAGDGGRDVRLKVTAAANRRFLRWETGAPLGMYTLRDAFEISDTEFGCTVVITREVSGPLEALLGRSEEDPRGHIEELGHALKAAAEDRAMHHGAGTHETGDR
jgi:hypothetical protein